MLHRVVWQFTDVSEMLAASIIRAMRMEAASTSETSATSTRLHGTSQNTVTIILAAVKA
jgi:hypothetical protein